MIELIRIEVLSLVFFGVGNFDARYFFGLKFHVRVFFLGLRSTSFPGPFPVPPPGQEKGPWNEVGLHYEAPSDPPPPPLPRHVCCEYPLPLGLGDQHGFG